jgi:uncharacterized protein YodC (DUF2158 family)
VPRIGGGLDSERQLVMNQEAKLKSGDVVRLKSGGPKMTVNNDSFDGTVYCVWFVEGDKKGDTFATATLTTDVADPPRTLRRIEGVGP